MKGFLLEIRGFFISFFEDTEATVGPFCRVDAGTRGATGRFGIHGGSSQATLTAAATVNIGASNTFMTVIGAGTSCTLCTDHP